MTTKEYLSQYREAQHRADRLRERLEQIQSGIGSRSADDGTPRGSRTSHPTEASAIRIVEARERLEDALIYAGQIQQQIADEIERVDGVLYQDLLFARYVQGSGWNGVTAYVSRYRDKPYREEHVRGYMHAEALRRFEAVRAQKSS